MGNYYIHWKYQNYLNEGITNNGTFSEDINQAYQEAKDTIMKKAVEHKKTGTLIEIENRLNKYYTMIGMGGPISNLNSLQKRDRKIIDSVKQFLKSEGMQKYIGKLQEGFTAEEIRKIGGFDIENFGGADTKDARSTLKNAKKRGLTVPQQDYTGLSQNSSTIKAIKKRINAARLILEHIDQTQGQDNSTEFLTRLKTIASEDFQAKVNSGNISITDIQNINQVFQQYERVSSSTASGEIAEFMIYMLFKAGEDMGISLKDLTHEKLLEIWEHPELRSGNQSVNVASTGIALNMYPKNYKGTLKKRGKGTTFHQEKPINDNLGKVWVSASGKDTLQKIDVSFIMDINGEEKINSTIKSTTGANGRGHLKLFEGNSKIINFLNGYEKFTYHYLNIMAGHGNNKYMGSAIDGMKNIVAFNAMTGGRFLTTGSRENMADVLIVNVRSQKCFKAYSIADSIDRILSIQITPKESITNSLRKENIIQNNETQDERVSRVFDAFAKRSIGKVMIAFNLT